MLINHLDSKKENDDQDNDEFGEQTLRKSQKAKKTIETQLSTVNTVQRVTKCNVQKRT